MKSFRHLAFILTIATLPLLSSCEFTSSEENDIDIWIISTGVYTLDMILDSDTPFSNIPLAGTKVIPAGNIKKATITVTRSSISTSLTIAIYNNNELDDNGYATLAACAPENTSCSNSLTLQYEVDGDDSDGTAATSSSDDEDED